MINNNCKTWKDIVHEKDIDDETQFEMAMKLFDTDKKSALELLHISARTYPSAQYTIGKCYMDGIGVEINTSKAIEYLLNSCSSLLPFPELAETFFLLGKYYDGKDYTKALVYYIYSFEEGHYKASYNIGIIYANLNNDEKMIEWLSIAVKNGNQEAEDTLIGYYLSNENYPEALKLYTKTSENIQRKYYNILTNNIHPVSHFDNIITEYVRIIKENKKQKKYIEELSMTGPIEGGPIECLRRFNRYKEQISQMK